MELRLLPTRYDQSDFGDNEVNAMGQGYKTVLVYLCDICSRPCRRIVPGEWSDSTHRDSDDCKDDLTGFRLSSQHSCRFCLYSNGAMDRMHFDGL